MRQPAIWTLTETQFEPNLSRLEARDEHYPEIVWTPDSYKSPTLLMSTRKHPGQPKVIRKSLKPARVGAKSQA